jgi:hypothetical protein
MVAFWDVAPCSLVDIDERFRGAYCLHHQDHTSETSVRLHGATSQKTSNLDTCHRENLRSHDKYWPGKLASDVSEPVTSVIYAACVRL